jgi:serine/threonine-protein kinase
MADPDLPARLGKYEIVRRLAYGGMAEVLLGRLSGADGFSRDVVIKRVLPQYVAHEQFISMFRDEARITARLSHGNIVQVVELGEEGGRFYLVLEYVDGPSLSAVQSELAARGERLSLRESVHVAVEIARALDYAHAVRGADGRSLELVHRDVTPSNILVSREGVVKLADFGVAKARARLTPTQAGAGVLKGKLAYMAPEAILAGRVEARSDLFALGVVLWEMLTGRQAFASELEAQVIMRVTTETPCAPSDVDPEIPLELDELVLRLLSREPADRPARAGEVAEILGRLRLPPGPEGLAASEALARTVARVVPGRSNLRTAETTRPPVRRRVLVVDGSRTLRALVKASLGRRAGVFEASTAFEARALLAIERFDVVVCQRSLEDASGLELCRAVRRLPRYQGVPFVLLASEVSEELIREAEAAGAQAVLPKIFDPAKLEATVEALLAATV